MMMSNMISNLNKKLEAVKIRNRCRRTAKAYVYRDDLISKSKQPPSPPELQKVKKRVRFAETEPVIIATIEDRDQETEEINKVLVRIRVKLTKEEANRMLSRCSDGGILEFGDVASELTRIPPARVCSSMLPN